MEELLGRQFGPYQVLSPLGRGGMAAVFKALQPSMNRHVALKVISPHVFAAHESDWDQESKRQFLHRFRHEAAILSRLQHPHILPVFDFGESDGFMFLVMPLIDSGTLTRLLKGRPLGLDVAERVVRQVGDALDYAHSQGIIHRDIKPTNILLDGRDNCLLADFGIARISEGATRLTMTGLMMGTPAYMSPEQAVAEPVGPASDIYSLGIVLYEMLTGNVPHTADTPVALAVKHVTAPLPSPRVVNPALTPQIEAVVLKALARAPHDRFASAAAFVAEFTSAVRAELDQQRGATVVSQRSAAAPSYGTVLKPVLNDAGATDIPQSQPPPSHVSQQEALSSAPTTARRANRRRGMMIAAAALAGLAAIAGAVIALRPDTEQPQRNEPPPAAAASAPATPAVDVKSAPPSVAPPGDSPVAADPAAAPFTLVARDGRRPIPVVVNGGRELIAIDEIAKLLRLDVREDPVAGGLTVSYRGRTVAVTADQPLAAVDGRIVSLPVPVVHAGSNRWLVPIEFVPRAIGGIYDRRMTFRPEERLLILGDVSEPLVGDVSFQQVPFVPHLESLTVINSRTLITVPIRNLNAAPELLSSWNQNEDFDGLALNSRGDRVLLFGDSTPALFVLPGGMRLTPSKGPDASWRESWRDAAFSGDGNVFAALSFLFSKDRGKTLLLVGDGRTGRTIARRTIDGKSVFDRLTIRPDGAQIALQAFDGQIAGRANEKPTIVDTMSGAVVKTFDIAYPSCLGWTPDGSVFVSGGRPMKDAPEEITFYDPRDWSVSYTLRDKTCHVRSFSEGYDHWTFSPDSRLVALRVRNQTSGGTIEIRAIRDGSLVGSINRTYSRMLRFSADGKYLVLRSDEFYIEAFDTTNWQPVSSIRWKR